MESGQTVDMEQASRRDQAARKSRRPEGSHDPHLRRGSSRSHHSHEGRIRDRQHRADHQSDRQPRVPHPGEHRDNKALIERAVAEPSKMKLYDRPAKGGVVGAGEGRRSPSSRHYRDIAMRQGKLPDGKTSPRGSSCPTTTTSPALSFPGRRRRDDQGRPACDSTSTARAATVRPTHRQPFAGRSEQGPHLQAGHRARRHAVFGPLDSIHDQRPAARLPAVSRSHRCKSWWTCSTPAACRPR